MKVKSKPKSTYNTLSTSVKFPDLLTKQKEKSCRKTVNMYDHRVVRIE